MNNTNKHLKFAIFSILAALILFYITFVVKPLNFWICMTLTVSSLALFAVYMKRKDLFRSGITAKHLLLGIFSAILLYGIFYFGNIISGYLFPFKNEQISLIYGNKSQLDPAVIGLLLLFIIGPGEEIFWRGFIQNTFSAKFGAGKGYILASLVYTGVHIPTGNFMLVLAAFICGVYWGWIYKKTGSLVPVIVSHAVWDLVIFVLIPVR